MGGGAQGGLEYCDMWVPLFIENKVTSFCTCHILTLSGYLYFTEIKN